MQKVMSLDCAKAGNLRGAMELLPLPLDLPASFSQDVGWMLKCFYYWFLNVLSRINMTAFLFLFRFLAGSATYDFYWVSVAVLLGLRIVSVLLAVKARSIVIIFMPSFFVSESRRQKRSLWTAYWDRVGFFLAKDLMVWLTLFNVELSPKRY